ncbi:MAG: heme-copper oxidase subunit III [Chloroflexi bacterium]|nr:heme-copper oxidase subunit III [Chloroflexota bacterium]
MWLFLASECLFFGSLIAAYLLYRGQHGVPCMDGDLSTCVFPTDRTINGVEYEGIFDIPFTSVSAFVLLMSSVSMVLALAAIQRGNVRAMRIWLFTTAALGALFVGGQAFEFTEFYREGLTLETNLFGTTFYVLTGFHGAHVTIGVLVLFSLLIWSSRGKIQAKDSLNIELAGLYWHFVDIVWIVIFTLIYLIQP